MGSILQKGLFVFGLVVAPLLVSAQIGAGVKYTGLTSSPWLDVLMDDYPSSGVELSGYYWFRLKEKRIEFLPEIGYGLVSDISGDDSYLNLDYAFVNFNTDFYLFDLINDCDCPTFSKQGNAFQRSFFIEVSVGADYQFLEKGGTSEDTYKDNDISFRLGVGIGFDIGISDLITVTPLIKMNYRTSPGWDAQALSGESEAPGGSEWLFTPGIRAMFRPDYTRRYR